MQKDKSHISVLLDEAITGLAINPDGIYIDCTFGRGGHSGLILSQLSEHGQLIAIDRDPTAIKAAEKFADDARFSIEHEGFAYLNDIAEKLGLNGKVDGVLMDLGVSSPQLDQADRGFSFMRDGHLDMRMDPTGGESASDWLARVDERDLMMVLFDLGEEKFARRIARAIVETRVETPIESTLQLAAIVSEATPKKDKNKHPATRTFQAIRLHVNQELSQVSDALPQAVELLNQGGRLSVISFHSLEDRIVKRFRNFHTTLRICIKNSRL